MSRLDDVQTLINTNQNDFNGWLIPPRDEDSLYNVMREAMLLPKNHLVKMGSEARSIIKSRYEQHEHWTRMSYFYHELLH
jgi:glycosyltransferase involved in cell wall biosynthesis